MLAEFGVLGPFSAVVAGSPVALGAGKPRVVLASLLMRANRLVTLAELVDRVWGQDAPANAKSALHMHVMRLRKALGAAGELIESRPGGYLIRLPQTSLDLLLFNDHLAAAAGARLAADPAAEVAALAAGLRLWRGEPLADVASEVLRRAEVPFLVEQRLQATERMIEIDVQQGRHHRAIGELRKLIVEHPLREQLWVLLLTALYRSGRRADALEAYQEVRALLAEELGLEPGPALAELQQQILTDDPALSPLALGPVTGRQPVCQLPGDTADFVGRADLVSQIHRYLTGGDGAPVVVLAGPPGVGKTALAVHAARRFAGEFPDGQLWVDLRGYSGGAAMSPTAALSQFLRTLGLPPEQIGLAGLDELSSLFRQYLAGRRAIIVLDNAAEADQVRPLLPGTPGCAVIVTSRANLAGLTATHGALRIAVPTLTPDDADVLLRRMLGADLVSAEPGAAAELAKACGLLPLALRIAAASLAEAQGGIAEYVGRLRADRIGELVIDGDDHTAVRVAFDHSYARLEPEAARMFRVLGLVPGPDFDRLAVASLAGLALDQASRVLRSLTGANLVQRESGNRYRLHDLLRDYAADRSRVHDAPEARHAARQRLYSYYLTGTDAAARLLYPDRWRGWPLPDAVAARADTPRPDWGEDRAAAWAWLELERANLVAAIRHDLGGTDLPSWLLTDALYGFFLIQRHLEDWDVALRAGRRVATARRDRYAAAILRLQTGALNYQFGRLSAAGREYTRALRLFRQVGDGRGQAAMHNNLGVLAYYRGDTAAALDHYRKALTAHRAEADTVQVARALNNLGYLCEVTGHPGEAESYLTESLALTLADPALLALRTRGLLTLGWVHLESGRLAEATEVIEQGRALAVELGLRPDQATAADLLARINLTTGHYRRAIALARQTLTWATERHSHEQQISAHNTLGMIDLRLGQTARAADHFETAHALALQTEHRSLETWEAALGRAACHRRRGEFDTAREFAGGSVSSPVRAIQARAHTEIARIDLDLGDHAAALEHSTQAIGISRGCGYRLDEAHALALSGRIHHARGDRVPARAACQRALDIYAQAGAPESAEIAAQLSRLDGA